jgi:hypothetical protein
MSSTVTIVISVLSLSGTILTAIIAGFFTLHSARRASQQEARKLHSKYRQPLLLAAHDLQGRLHSFLDGGFRRCYKRKQDYVIYHTVYLIAQYFAWLEILRREVQFLESDRSGQSQKFWESEQRVFEEFHTGRWGHDFMIWAGEQHSIGDVMIDHDKSNGNQKICLSYPAFRSKYQDAQERSFRAWFQKLAGEVDLLARRKASETRLRHIQVELVDLVKVLDTDGIFPLKKLETCKLPTDHAPHVCRQGWYITICIPMSH